MNDLGADKRIDLGGLDISGDAVGLASNIQDYIDYLDALLAAVTGDYSVGGQGVVILTNQR